MGSPGRIAMLHKWVMGDQTIDHKKSHRKRELGFS